MLRLEGELCEVGDLQPGKPGFSMELRDGRVVTVSGLDRSEVPAGLFRPVVLSLSQVSDRAANDGEAPHARGDAAEAALPFPVEAQQVPPTSPVLSDEQILRLVRQCGMATGPNLRKSDGCYYYRSHGTPTNVRDRDLITLVRVATAAGTGLPASPQPARPPMDPETLAKRFAARLFSGRKGHGRTPVSYMQITETELATIVAAALQLQAGTLPAGESPEASAGARP